MAHVVHLMNVSLSGFLCIMRYTAGHCRLGPALVFSYLFETAFNCVYVSRNSEVEFLFEVRTRECALHG
jgi:ribosome biogenesis protein Nip4